jgi:hypothetical protein
MEIRTEHDDTRAVTRIIVHGHEISVYAYEHGSYTFYVSPDDGNPHTGIPLAQGNVKTGASWTNRSRSRQNVSGWARS